MVDFLTLGFLQRSLMAAALTGGVCAAIGVFVVLRGLAFIGAGTAHAAFAGVALAYLLGGPPMPFAIAFGLGTAWIIGLLEERGRMKLDVSIGISYTATMALAILFIGLMKTYNAEVYGYLFGSILSVTADELKLTAGLAAVVVGLLTLFAKEFFFLAFDQEMAEASGVPARRFFFLLLTLVALTIVVSLKTVGAILVFALLLIPAATAYQLTSSLRGGAHDRGFAQDRRRDPGLRAAADPGGHRVSTDVQPAPDDGLLGGDRRARLRRRRPAVVPVRPADRSGHRAPRHGRVLRRRRTLPQTSAQARDFLKRLAHCLQRAFPKVGPVLVRFQT